MLQSEILGGLKVFKLALLDCADLKANANKPDRTPFDCFPVFWAANMWFFVQSLLPAYIYMCVSVPISIAINLVQAVHPRNSFLMSLGLVGRDVFAQANSISMFSISTARHVDCSP